MPKLGSFFERKQTPRTIDRVAALLLLGGSLFSILVWTLRIGGSDFAEPLQIAQVGHYAPWRQTGLRKHIVTVGTERRDNDIVLHDRKASSHHLQLERRGGKGHWWALLRNRSRDRRIVIRRLNGTRLSVNRHRLREGDRFLLPLDIIRKNASFQGLRQIDWCRPSQLLQLLRTSPTQTQPTHTTPRRALSTQQPPSTMRGQSISFQIGEHRSPLRWREPRMRLLIGKQRRELLLSEHQRYRLPKSKGGGWLVYRHQRWQQTEGKSWKTFQGPLRWGKAPTTRLELLHRTTFSMVPGYTLGHTNSSCPFPLREAAIPGGLEIAGMARLYYQNKRLHLQHLGQGDRPLQLLPGRGPARVLGTANLYDGDLLSLGQLVYRTHIDKRGVRLMLTRLPQGGLFPFFSSYPSHHYPMRRLLPETRQLLVTGGGGGDPQADRWTVRTSLVGEPGKTRLTAPYRPLMGLQLRSSGKLHVTPLGAAQLYRADPKGKLRSMLPAKGIEEPAGGVYYGKRFYFRVHRPSYHPLAWRLALLWGLLFSAAVGFLFWLIYTGRLLWSPIPPSQSLDRLLPWDDLRHSLCREKRTQGSTEPTIEGHDAPSPRRRRRGWLWMLWVPTLAMLPIAIFLNGMGLYVLATLSLSSLGLNNNAFLYRQLLWSLVGIVLFVAVIVFPPDGWQRLKALFLRPQPKRAIEPTRDAPPFFRSRRFRWWGLFFACLAVFGVWLFSSWMLLLIVAFCFGCVCVFAKEIERARPYPLQQKSLRFFFVTLLLLGFVPLLGLLVPGAVHNRFFLVVPGAGTVKLSEFAILTAIYFFAGYLGHELFELRLRKARRQTQERRTEKQRTSPDGRDATLPELSAVAAMLPHERGKILFGALQLSFLYLFLLGSICVLYTVQGDLGPGLILTLCFSIYILFIFIGPGVDRLVTAGNLLRILVVFGGLALLFWLPDLLATLFPDWALRSSELQKVRERLALWNQPWRFMVGEQLLQNQWDLAGYRGAFQWFNNLHSDFVFTAVVRVLSPFWGYVSIFLACTFPLMSLGVSWLHWYPLVPKQEGEQSFGDDQAALEYKRQSSIRSLLMLFGGIYLFAQNFIHIGSTLRLTPMTGVTFTWISSGGTSLVACYVVLALIYRQLRHHPFVGEEAGR